MNRSSFIGILALAMIAGAAFPQERGREVLTPPSRGVPATPTAVPAELTSRLSSGVVFIENEGQFDPRVKFLAKVGAKTAWLTAQGIVFDVTRPKREDDAAKGKREPSQLTPGRPEPMPAVLDRLVFAEDLVEMNCCSKPEGRNPLPGVYNYFQSQNSKEWHTDVRGFAEVLYRDVWPGIDLRVSGNGSDLEQEFIVQPGGDLGNVRISYRGINGLTVAPDGSLVVDTAFGQMRETKPVVYQQVAGARASVDGHFKLTSATSYTFDVGAHKMEYALVIDPTLLYSTFLGGSSTNNIYGMAVDSSGSSYVAGITASQDFPETSGTLQAGYNAFVAKLNPSGGSLAYSNILGKGYPFFYGGGITIDSKGNAYVTGYGYNMPATASAYSSCSGFDGFLTVLAPTGNQLVYSTCLHSAASVGLAVDSGGRAFLAGQTGCSLATTPNAYQSNCPSGSSGFLRVLDTTLSGAASLVYSTYLGDPSQSLTTYVGGIALDPFGRAYVTGQVYSNTNNTGQFPTTPGALSTTLAACTPKPSGENESYCQWPWVAKFDTSQQGVNSLIYSTYLGYAGQTTQTGDGIPFTMPLNMGIAVDGSGNAYITGGGGNTYPTTPGAFQTTGSGTFVTKLNASGSGMVYSTFLPTNPYPYGGGTFVYTSPFTPYLAAIGFPIAVDVYGKAYISGNTSATSYPVTADAFQNKLADSALLGGGGDAFLTVLNPAGSGLVYSSYLGGGKAEEAIAVAVDQIGDVYVAGQTNSLDFPVTAGAYQAAIKGTSSNLFISKFPLATTQALSVSSVAPAAGGNSGTVTLQIFGTGFHAGATAELNCPAPIVGANPTVGTAGRAINATFDLTGVLPGICDIVVTNLGGASVTLAGAFTVQQGGTPNIQIYMTGLEHRRVPPEVASGPADALVTATVSNIGNNDSVGGFISLLSNQFTLTSANPAGLGHLGQGSADDFEVWPSGPIASGSSQQFALTGTAALTPACAGTGEQPPLQVCFIPYTNCHEDQTKLAACLVQPGNLLSSSACVLGIEQCFAGVPLGPVGLAACILGIADCGNSQRTIVDQCMAQAEVCDQGSPICFSDELPCLQPSDPNDLLGPPGVGGQRWTPGQAQTYLTSFSNVPSAPLPAQQVIVTLPLGSNVNLSTLSLLGITIPNGSNDAQVFVPAGAFNPSAGLNEFTTNIDLRPAQGLLVNVDALLNPSTQTLTWTLTSIDPATGQPPVNPLIGFLPAGAGASVSYSFTPKPGLATGTQIAQQASIVFVGNSPMNTATWINTIDNTPPVSAVSALAATQTTSCFRPQWTASDVGSGVQGTTIFVSDTGAPYTPWITNTASASGVYNGVAGHTYRFYSQATDLVGNVEATHAGADASTSIPAGASCNGKPTIAASAAGNTLSGTTESLTLQLTNNGNGSAQNIKITSVSLRTLVGTGSVTLSSPAIPIAVGSLAAGATTTEMFTLNAPATVREYSITEAGTVQDAAGNTYSFSVAQALIP